MKRVVGIVDTCQDDIAGVNINYVKLIENAGCIPLIIPETTDKVLIEETISHLDMVLLAGGTDVNPKYYTNYTSELASGINNRRDAFEIAIIEACQKQKVRIFGICRGIQIINVYFGGTLYQDLWDEKNDTSIEHQRPDKKYEVVHDIILENDNFLSNKLTEEIVSRGDVKVLGVNSTHHQAMKKLAEGFLIAGKSEDNVIEAIYSEMYNIEAVQFHIERLPWGYKLI